MIGVEIFSGAGGMSLGASLAGVDIKLGIEIDKYAALTFKHNHKGSKVINKDIRVVKSIPVRAPKDQQKILFGGPPCQGFSRSNKRTRNADNPNNWLFEECIRLTKSWKPDWVVLENVEGILGTEEGLFIDGILSKLKIAGYETNHFVLNAMDCGVPQNRERVFIVGSLHGCKLDISLNPIKQKVTVKQAISDLPSLPNGNTVDELSYKSAKCSVYAKSMRLSDKCKNHGVTRNQDFVLERYDYIPQGGNWADIPSRLMKTYTDSSRCHSGIYHRLAEDAPSVVIGNYRKNMLIHPWENRGLSVREAARLQSFPDWFEFQGYLGDQQQQVGNAVPPLLAKSVFDKIISQK